MTSLAEFYTLVSSEIRRGTSFDASIARKVQHAVDWFEQLHRFQYMEKYDALTIVTTGNNPRAIPQPTGFEKMLGWRITIDGRYENIGKVDFYDVDRVDTAQPSAYWQDGKDYFWLDNTPDQEYSSEMAYVAKTVLGTDTSAEPAVIQKYEGIILAATMIMFAPALRDPAVVGLYKPNRDDLMKSAIDADVDARQSWQSESSQYGWEFREHVNKGD